LVKYTRKADDASAYIDMNLLRSLE
jgi:hypothetical protein